MTLPWYHPWYITLELIISWWHYYKKLYKLCIQMISHPDWVLTQDVYVLGTIHLNTCVFWSNIYIYWHLNKLYEQKCHLAVCFLWWGSWQHLLVWIKHNQATAKWSDLFSTVKQCLRGYRDFRDRIQTETKFSTHTSLYLFVY